MLSPPAATGGRNRGIGFVSRSGASKRCRRMAPLPPLTSNIKLHTSHFKLPLRLPLPMLRVARVVPEFCARARPESRVTPCAGRNKEFLARGVFYLLNCCTNVVVSGQFAGGIPTHDFANSAAIRPPCFAHHGLPSHFSVQSANMCTRAVQGRRRCARTRRQSRIPTASRALATFSGGGSWAESFGRRPIGGFLRKESDSELRFLVSGLIRLCPVSSGSGHV